MINLTTVSYPIIIEPALRFQIKSRLEEMGHKRLAVVTDSTVWELYGKMMTEQLSGFSYILTVLKPGELSKSHENLMGLYRQWLSGGLTRTDVVLAFGGGVIGDLSGYAAATYFRGVPFIQIPTTLLAQVDSSIGGKVAVNLPEGKNLIGTFYHPKAVWIDPDFLQTLPKSVFKDGMAEVVKAGFIMDEVLCRLLKEAREFDEPQLIKEMIQRSILVKKQLVEADEKENHLRKRLNFGHTIGHALEAHGQYTRWTHGEAVAMGMVWMTRCSEASGLSQKGVSLELVEVLKKLELPISTEVPLRELMKWLIRDKKKKGNTLEVVLIKKAGISFLKEVSEEELYTFFSNTGNLEK